ncbi:EAL domain-containing protein [Azohydromonas aeria]|uniref:EAL domain-containing protein n=1 Tax=Azohydromonas aeria TaxID=2590212 RepID=UPI0012F99AAE|nr:EAL domain-containing protein [Azohydromonas aeria]
MPAATAGGRAWLLMADDGHAEQVGAELTAAGWQVELQLGSLQLLLLHLYCEAAPPDVLLCGLRLDDGDAFRLMRLLSGDPRAPALFFTTRQPRGVLDNALAMGEACGLEVAGGVTWPAAPGRIAQALRTYRQTPGARTAAADAGELTAPELRALLQDDGLHAWLQPRVRLPGLEAVGVEAFMRGVAGDGSLLGPQRLVPALQRHGLLESATLVLAHQVVAFLAGCRSEGMALTGSINVSLHSLSDAAFCAELSELAQRHGIDPGWITLEISEKDTAADLPTVIENTARCRLLGFNLCIDDFGTGYSNLLQLSRLPFSALKIDQSFIAGIDSDATRQVIVKACADLAHGLGLRVVAEGVETAAQLQAVGAAGCTEAQGSALSPPMPLDEARQWLRSLEPGRRPRATPR